MKTSCWFNQNRLSYLRVATAGTIALITNNVSVKNPISRSPWRRGFFLIPLVLVCFALSPAARAQLPSPAPDGGYPGSNTAEGDGALFNLTTGLDNTAMGFQALYFNTTGSDNTANGGFALYRNTIGIRNTAHGAGALASNTTGGNNTANGVFALSSNTTGGKNTADGVQTLGFNTTGADNTANGFQALFNNTSGNGNTANGVQALWSNTTGFDNTANGGFALYRNTIGIRNTANGVDALASNTTGGNNTANGVQTLGFNTTGAENTANGFQALWSNTIGSSNTANGVDALWSNTTGSSNIALGFNAGQNLTTGDNNIDIGNPGIAAEAKTIRIGTVGTQTAIYVAGIMGKTVPMSTPVFINANGLLGTTTSSARFKDAIKPMGKASEGIFALKPVTFRYKKELDPEAVPQFGLVAEDVEKVNPDLVARDDQGKVYTVRYEAVNAMLLNEFLKEHRAFLKEKRKVKEQEASIAQLKSTVAQQQKGMELLAAHLKEQDSKIERVSAQLEVTKPAPQMVLNTQTD